MSRYTRLSATLLQSLMVLGLGVVLSAASLAVGDQLSPSVVPQLLAVLEAQVPVFSLEAGDLAANLHEDVLVVDGRSWDAHRAAHPANSLNIPFEERNEGIFDTPGTRPVRSAIVVMESVRATEARALAQWLGRTWALPSVATLKGGWETWLTTGLPVEGRKPR